MVLAACAKLGRGTRGRKCRGRADEPKRFSVLADSNHVLGRKNVRTFRLANVRLGIYKNIMYSFCKDEGTVVV